MRSPFFFAFGLTLTLAACGSDPAPATDGGTSTDTPAATDTGSTTDAGSPGDVPAATDTGAATDAGAATDTGAAADVPAATDAGATTDVPTGTDVPTSTDVPAVTDVPAATDTGTPTDMPVAADVSAAPTFTQVYAIISANCASCHVGGSSGGLTMTTREQAYTNLSAGRVLPGSAAMSRLHCKVTGGASCGSRMPLGRAPLSDAQIRLIGGWINAGARND